MRKKRIGLWIVSAIGLTCILLAIYPIVHPAQNSIMLESEQSNPHGAMYSLDLTENTTGTLVAERWENGKKTVSDPVAINPDSKQIQLYATRQDEGIMVQLGVENGDTVMQRFDYPEGKTAIGEAFATIVPEKKTILKPEQGLILAALTPDFAGKGVFAMSCDMLTTNPSLLEEAPFLVVFRLVINDPSTAAH